jgi:NADH-quinone oxidoreductase subunit C
VIPAQRDISGLLEGDLARRVPGAVLETLSSCGECYLRIAPARLVELCRFLKEDTSWQFAFLASASCVDWLARTPRFEVVYHLRSLVFNHRLGLKVDVPDDTLSLPSLAGVWRAADWHEREIFDLYGVRFAGHPDLRRIMMPEDWEGHPYRRDYPLEGRGEGL